jgi:hypothetical protein
VKHLTFLTLGLFILSPSPFLQATNLFRAADKIFITNQKPKTKIEISLQRITFRKLVADNCGEVSFESTTVPVLVLTEASAQTLTKTLLDTQEFNPSKFVLTPTRICSKNSPKSDRSYKTSNTRFVLAGLNPQHPYLVKIIKPDTRALNINTCGYGAIPITQSLTPFAASYQDNIYAINGKKLKELITQKPPKC